MVMVKCTSDYWEFVRQLRLDSRTIHGFIETTDINQEQQADYMSKYNDHYFICLVDNTPAGFIGSINNDIRVCTAPEFQKMGIAKFMVDYIMDLFPTSYAKVKIDNNSSKKLFLKCGFKEKYIIYKK